MGAPTFNSYDKYIFYCTAIDTPAEFTAASSVLTAGVAFIGVCKADTGWMVEKSVSQRDSLGNERVIRRKLTIDMDFMTALSSGARTAIDGKTPCLLLVDAADCTVDEGAGTVTLGTAADATLLYPVELEVVDDMKFGADLFLTKIRGEVQKATKAELYKTVSIANT